MKLKLDFCNEKLIALLLGLICIYIYISELSPYFVPLSVLRMLIYPIIYTLGVIGYFRSIKTKPNNLLLILFFIVFVISNCIIYPRSFYYLIGEYENTNFILSDLFYIGFISIPIICLMRCQRDNTKLIKELNKIGNIIILLFIITFIVKILIFNDKIEYMNISYGVLPWILFSFNNKRKIMVFIRMISILFIVVIGCRGAIFTVFAFYAIYFCFERITLKKLIQLMIGLIAIFLVIINLNTIVQITYNYLKEIGFNSRTLELYLDISVEDGILHYSDREELQMPLIKQINAFGYGIYGDRDITSTHQYAHNIILELLIDFGMLLGGIFCICLLSLMINAFASLYRITDKNKRILICVSLSFLCCKYMFSASYLHLPEFWFFLSIIINNFRDNKLYTYKSGGLNGK